jgi:hypothetical protein
MPYPPVTAESTSIAIANAQGVFAAFSFQCRLPIEFDKILAQIQPCYRPQFKIAFCSAFAEITPAALERLHAAHIASREALQPSLLADLLPNVRSLNTPATIALSQFLLWADPLD